VLYVYFGCMIGNYSKGCVRLIGGVAQWLGHWSLPGGLYLLCSQSIWLTGDRFEGKPAMGHHTKPTQPSILPGSVNE